MLLKTFNDLVHKLCDASFQHCAPEDLNKHNSLIAMGMVSEYYEPAYHFAKSRLGASNHQQLAQEAFENKQSNLVKEAIQELLRIIPALDHPTLDIGLSIYAPKKKHVIALSVYKMTFGGGKGQQITTVLKKLETAASHLQGVPKPGHRTFQIEGKELPAADLESACKLWAAFNAPDAFENTPLIPPDISEIISYDERQTAMNKALRSKCPEA